MVNPANVDLWHSATFSWDGEIVAFGDESGGGGAARCVNPDDQQGRIWFLDTDTGDLLTNYKIPRSVSETCTMHNLNFIYANDIVRGVDVYLLSDKARAGDRKLPHLNPQTQESTIG